MTDFANKLAAMASKCVQRLGTVEITVYQTAESVNPATLATIGASTPSGLVTAIKAARSGEQFGDLGGATVVETKYTVEAAALAFTPAIGDTVVDGALSLPICDVERRAGSKLMTLVCRTNRQE